MMYELSYNILWKILLIIKVIISTITKAIKTQTNNCCGIKLKQEKTYKKNYNNQWIFAIYQFFLILDEWTILGNGMNYFWV